ncbi:MAG: cation-translocating P-type ATPase [Spirochaetales bacterium]|nr:cation-translocating P-type ATPase [Spirochaetales bacterium]
MKSLTRNKGHRTHSFFLSKKNIVLATGGLLVVSFGLRKILGYDPLNVALLLLSTLLAGYPIVRKAVGALRYGIVGIETLVTIAVLGALLIGEYWEGAVVTFLFVLGNYLESRTIEKTRSTIRALLDLAPKTARVLRDGVESCVKASEVVQNDLVVLKAGEKIPADGTVTEGSSFVNQATITGEPVAVSRKAGDLVFAGTILESGYLILKADRVSEDTTFARILHMVEEAQDKKARTQRVLEKFSRFYTPAILLLSLTLYLLGHDLVLALTLLVIACPGALVISAPISLVAGIGNGAKNGVLVKGGDVLEKLGRVRAFAFDKTGTLTKGSPQVVAIRGYALEAADLLRLAAVGESYSEHPLAKAILQYAAGENCKTQEKPEGSLFIAGQGIKFNLGEKTYLMGNRRLFAEHGVDLTICEDYLVAEEEKARTAVLVGDSQKLLGVLSISDVVRDEAKELIADLRNQGVRRLVMLTGDNARSAKAMSMELGLDGYYAELLPEHKVSFLREMQKKYGRTAMVGDGVNDTPALASADLGIAVGAAGSEIAMETADVVLVSSDLRKLSYAVGLSRATVRNMTQNIVFALLVAASLLAGVLGKVVNLSFGMLVHEISVLVVVLNAVRLLGWKKKTAFSRNLALNPEKIEKELSPERPMIVPPGPSGPIT